MEKQIMGEKITMKEWTIESIVDESKPYLTITINEQKIKISEDEIRQYVLDDPDDYFWKDIKHAFKKFNEKISHDGAISGEIFTKMKIYFKGYVDGQEATYAI